jgi:hypothetical protein
MDNMIQSASKDWVQEQFVKEFIRPKLQPTDFYWDEGKMVMSESYHIRRGSCCGNKCKHCPYEPSYQKGNTNVKESLRNQ